MNLEIEYRYLIDRSFFNNHIRGVITPSIITQSYLIHQKEFHMRLRVEHPANKPSEKKATLTTKTGKKPKRQEYEITIPLDYAEVLYQNALSTLTKWRYKVEYSGLTWEIDYYPDHDLVIGEVEVPSEDFQVLLPNWALNEVTLDNKYSNTTLAKKR